MGFLTDPFDPMCHLGGYVPPAPKPAEIPAWHTTAEEMADLRQYAAGSIRGLLTVEPRQAGGVTIEPAQSAPFICETKSSALRRIAMYLPSHLRR